jgi:hypothetical protein
MKIFTSKIIWKFAGHNDALKRLAAWINVSSHKILSTGHNYVDETKQDRMSAKSKFACLGRMEAKKHLAPDKHRMKVKFTPGLA